MKKQCDEKTWYKINENFGFRKQIFLTAVMFFSCNALKCVSMNNQELK